MTIAGNGLIVIGENVNATRKIKATSPRIVREGDQRGLAYTDLDGTDKRLDVTEAFPDDPAAERTAAIPHIAIALRHKNLDYLTWAIRAQEAAGAGIIDLCVDEMSHYPEERAEWMRWLVRTAQAITGAVLAIDSSDPETIKAGLEVHDDSRARPAINSVSLEESRRVLIDMAKARNAYIFANASGRSGMPQNAEERVTNLREIMAMMDAAEIPMGDRFLDPLVFPIGANPEFGNHYLDAVRALRAEFPEVHIFGGHSNVSFGLPRRRLINHGFIVLAVLAGCDTLMIDPLTNPAKDYVELKYAFDVITATDEYAVNYLRYCRARA